MGQCRVGPSRKQVACSEGVTGEFMMPPIQVWAPKRPMRGKHWAPSTCCGCEGGSLGSPPPSWSSGGAYSSPESRMPADASPLPACSLQPAKPACLFS